MGSAPEVWLKCSVDWVGRSVWASTRFSHIWSDFGWSFFVGYACDAWEVDDPDEVIGRGGAGLDKSHLSSPIKVHSQSLVTVYGVAGGRRGSAAGQKAADAKSWEEVTFRLHIVESSSLRAFFGTGFQ
jgi:hypothetical protein